MCFAYGENKKSLMSYDEILFTDMYRNQWKHLHNKFGHTSWKKNETAAVPVKSAWGAPKASASAATFPK